MSSNISWICNCQAKRLSIVLSHHHHQQQHDDTEAQQKISADNSSNAHNKTSLWIETNSSALHPLSDTVEFLPTLFGTREWRRLPHMWGCRHFFYFFVMGLPAWRRREAKCHIIAAPVSGRRGRRLNNAGRPYTFGRAVHSLFP